MLISDVGVTSRTRTPEGMLRAPATLTQAGIVEYDAGELGVGPRGTMVTVERTVETMRHPDTLSSIMAAPLTIGHPAQGVDPNNWKREAVGSVVGTPKVDVMGRVMGEVIVGDKDAISRLEAGADQLSIGYDFDIEPSDGRSLAAYITSGPMMTNHIGIVETGRAGPGVRIADVLSNDQ